MVNDMTLNYVVYSNTSIQARTDGHTALDEANARLIASSPDAVLLFEDLQEYLSEHGGQGVELLSRIDAWLAKATGGTE